MSRFCQLHRLARLNTSAKGYRAWRKNGNIFLKVVILEIQNYWNKIF